MEAWSFVAQCGIPPPPPTKHSDRSVVMVGVGIDGVAVLTKTLKYREENCERKGFSDRWGESEIRIKSGSKVNETCDTKVGDSILLIIYCKMRRKRGP